MHLKRQNEEEVLEPQYDFIFVHRNGDQYVKSGEIMRKLFFSFFLLFFAIGKYIHPTRYHQNVETQSLNRLNSEEQRILSGLGLFSCLVMSCHVLS